MVNRDHACFFRGAHAAKDSGIAYELGKQAKLGAMSARKAARETLDEVRQAMNLDYR